MNERVSAATKLRIAVMASGSGTTLQAVIDACDSGQLDGEVVVVVSNNSHSGAVARADRHGIPCRHLSSRTHPEPAELDVAIASTLAGYSPDVVLLAGYMKKLGPRVLATFRNRIINTHPSLLPRFGGQGMYGAHVHAAVIAAGEATTGVSVHLVDDDYDTGRVLAQRDVAVAPEDDAETLASRVQVAEKPFLVEVLQQIAVGSIRLDDDRRAD